MKRQKYTVMLQSQLGPRTGELTLQEEAGVVSGTFYLLGHRNGFTGQMLEEGKFLISGTLRTAVDKESYDAIFTLRGGRLVGGVVAEHGCWDLTGYQTSAASRSETE